MTGKQHLTLGIAAGSTLAYVSFVNNSDAILSSCVAAATILGELYPDIDIESSILGRMVRPLSHLVNKIFGHRGFIHTPLNALITGFVLYEAILLINASYASILTVAFIIGFLLHLIQDTLTKGGIKWFWPLSLRIHLTPVKANSSFCWVMTIALCVAIMFGIVCFKGEVIGFF